MKDGDLPFSTEIQACGSNCTLPTGPVLVQSSVPVQLAVRIVLYRVREYFESGENGKAAYRELLSGAPISWFHREDKRRY